VHSAEDYDPRVAPLRRQWPNPLLRFTIFDETPHKAPSGASERLSLYSTPAISQPEVTSKLPAPVVPHHSGISPLYPDGFIPPLPRATCVLPPYKIFPPPPPPIIFPTPSKPCSPHEYGAMGTAHCCPVTKGKADIQVLLSSFKEDLERILCGTFGTGYADKPSTYRVSGVDVIPPQTETTPVNIDANTSSRWCFVCKTSFAGVWYGCIKCPWHAVVSQLLESLD
jgi:next-to-BRCA1 protein 1